MTIKAVEENEQVEALFGEWMQEIQGYSTRYELAVEAVTYDTTDIDIYMESAYKEGFKRGYSMAFNMFSGE